MLNPDNIAFDNYCAYLSPTIERWGLVHDGAYHRSIVRGLLARVDNVTLFDLRDDPQALAAFAREHIADERVGVMELLLNQPTFDLQYSAAHNAALGAIDRWRARKVRICFEVWDGNFESLFQEPARELQARCVEMHARISVQKRFSYSDAERSSGVQVECRDVTWITQTGFESYDYILPSGEVATCPSSLDGTVTFSGWIIGTVPFGAKYGLIAPGDLVVRFSRGRVAEISGAHRKLCADLELTIARLSALQHVSEAAVGLSRAIASTARTHTAGHLWHERHLGFHIGLGARIPQTPHPDLLPIGPHLDLVFQHGVLRAEDDSELLAW